MRKFINLVALAALLFVPWMAKAQNTLTVADGSSTNAYVPVYGYWADSYLRSQVIYPASLIAESVTTVGMNGASITGLTFYTNESSVTLSSTFDVKLMEVTATTLSSFQSLDGATLVYSGTVSVSGNQMVVTFDSPYTYNGGNLLVDFSSTSTGNYSTTTYKGVESSGASVQGYSYSGASFVSPTQRNFIPKTTFTFTGGTEVTCPAVQSFSIVAVDSSSVTLEWIDTINSGATYSIDYWAIGGSDTLNTTASGNTVTITELDANTRYQFTITVVCSASDESVTLGTQCRTACGATALPFFVDFEDVAYNGAWYPCWDSTLHAGTDPSVNYVRNHTTGGSYAMYLQANASQNYNLVVGPSMDVDGDNIYCRFWAYLNNSGAWIKAGVISNIYDTSTFVPLVTIQGVGTGWNEYEFNTAALDASANYRVAWLAYYPASYDTPIGEIDDITVSEIPSCLRVNDFALESIDMEEATVSWVDHTNTSATYTVYYWANGTTDTLTANAIDTVVTLTDLNANTVYNMIVVVDCGSEPSNVFSFRTACGSLAVPFFDDFDSYDNGFWPPCWHRLRAHFTDPSVNAQFHHSGSQSMFLLASNDTTLFCTPSTVPLAGNKIQVRYHAFLNYNSYYSGTKWLKGGVMTDTNDISTFIALDSIGYQNFNDVFEEREFNTASLDASAEYWVAWMFYSDISYNYYGRGAVDDVSITQLSDCVRPAAAEVTNVGARQAQVSWNAVEDGGSYTVIYHTANDPASDDAQTLTVSGDTSVVITGLQPETHYYVWVATDCGGQQSDLRPAGDFTTLISCPSVIDLHAVDSLTTSDGATLVWTAGDVETEWEVVLDSNDAETVSDPIYVVSGLEPMTGHTLRVRAVCGDEDTSSAVTLAFATGCADATCNFTFNMTDSYGDGWSGNSIEVYQAGIEVGSVTISSGSSSTETVTVCSSAPVELRFTCGNFSTELGGYVTDGSGATVFTIEGMGSRYTGDLLAIIAVPCPDCIMPLGVAVWDSLTTASDVTIHWTAQEGQSSWIILLNDVYTNVSDTTYTFTGLEARTTYTAYVATDCDGDTSAFAPVTFTTDCATGSCDITVVSTADYAYTYYTPKLHVWQNGTEVATVNNATQQVNVCSGLPVSVILEAAPYPYYNPRATVTDGSDDELFNGTTSGYSSGDTLVYTPNACPSCLTPTGLHAVVIDSTMITIEWTSDENATEYLVAFNGGAYQTNGASNVYSEYMLSPNVAYTFSVKAICAPGDTSNARTFTVKTSCGQMVLPFVEDLEGNTQGDVPSCWTVVRPGYGSYPATSGSAHDGSNGMTLAADYNDSTTIASSLVPLLGNEISVSFWASVNSGNTLYAGVMTDLAYDTTFIPLLAVPDNGSTYTRYEFNTSTLPSYEQYYVAFRLVTGGSNRYADIDDIEIRQDEGCMYPANLADSTTFDASVLTWTNGGIVSYFVIQHRQNPDSAWVEDGNTSSTTYTINGLDPATTYEVRVGLICSSDTLWSTLSIVTGCAPLSLPYFEDFDSYANDVMPPCWIWSSTHCTHWDGGVFLRSYHGGGSEYVVMPVLDGAISKLKIEFDTKVGTPAENDGILIGVTDINGTLLAWLDTLQNPLYSRNNHVHTTVYFPNYINIMPGNAARVAFAQFRNWGEWALIDNINVEELPDCYPVASLVGHNLDDVENTTFSWTPQGSATQWQVYVDTVTVGLDSIENIPATSFVTVTDTFYTIPIGMIQGGGIYNFFVRSDCGLMETSGWVKEEFGAGTIIMNNSTVADTVEGCGFVVYDNGGPIPGYLPNSNSALVLRSENVGSELEVFGGKFGWGSSPATLTIYDGEGTAGTVLYTYSTVDGRDTMLNTVLATSTTGALTITFTVNGSMCHTGYELYIHCVGAATCPRPTELQAEMTSPTQAVATWTSSASNFSFYYRVSGAPTWVRQTVATNSCTLTGLVADTTYDMYVVALCSATDSSTASVVRQLSTTYVVPCDVPTGLTVGSITENSAVVSWTGHGETAWRLSCNGVISDISSTPYTLTGLNANTEYIIMVKALCSADDESVWSSAASFTTAAPGVTNYTVTATANNATMGSVTGGGVYEAGTTATLTAVPASGHRFVQWNDAVVTNPRTIVVTSDTAFTATFEAIPTFTVSVNYDATMGSVTGAGTYYEGDTVTLVATANAGYHFVGWSNSETSQTITFVISSNVTLTATFAADEVGVNYYDVTVVYDATMGIVTGGGNHIAEGTVVTLTATPNSGYRFLNWNTGETTASISFTLTSDTTFEATFEAIPTYTVSVNYDASMGTVTGAGSYLEGATATLVATANAGYRFLGWDNGETGNEISFVVTDNVTLTATFEAIPTYTVTVNYNATMGTVTGIPASPVLEGTEVTLTATANEGYHFTGWDNGQTAATITFTVNADITLTANFAQNQGIDDVDAATVSVYPNPASSDVTVEVEQPSEVTVIDMQGRTVIPATAVNSTLFIPHSSLPAGTYFLRITGEQTTIVRKLIVQ